MEGVSLRDTLIPVTGSSWKGVRYGCTTREGGVSQGPWASLNLGTHVGDDPDAVAENRRRLGLELPAEPLWLNQVHGTQVVDADIHPAGGSPPAADAAVTAQPGCVLVILTADCLPVVIADADGQVLGVAHAGWRGLAAGVLESTLDALRQRLPQARAWRAWIGPCIRQEQFEVGEDVRQAFLETDPATTAFFSARHGSPPGKWQADLVGLARHRLVKNGLDNETVHDSGLCTHNCDKLFHSYRRNPVCGRMATVAWLEPGNGLG